MRQVNHSYTCLKMRVTPVRFCYARDDAAHFGAIVIKTSDISAFNRKPQI